MFTQVFDSLFRPGETTLDVTDEVISGDFALIHWVAETPQVRCVGFDSFTLRDGLIAAAGGGHGHDDQAGLSRLS